MKAAASPPDELKVPPDLFKDVKYYLIGTIDEKVQKLLTDGGAKQDYYMSEMITHTIADDVDADEVSEAKELFELTVVSSQWVTMSVRCGCHLPTEAFQLDQDQVFRGVVACPSQLAASDSNTLWALITYHGGRCQRTLTRDVTHLVCSKAKGAKYERAMQTAGAVKIVTPDWFLQCIKEKKKVPEDRYHPRLLIVTPPPEPSPPPPQETPEPVPEPPMPIASPALAQPPPVPRELPLPATLPGLPPGLPNGPRPDSFRTKEVLARMVSNRLQGKMESPTEPMPVSPLMGVRPGMPMMPGTMQQQQQQLQQQQLQQQQQQQQQQQGPPMQVPGLGPPPRGPPGQPHMHPGHSPQGPLPHQSPGHLPPGHLPPQTQGHMPQGHMVPQPGHLSPGRMQAAPRPPPGHMSPYGQIPHGHMPQGPHMSPGHMQQRHMQAGHMQQGHMQPGHMPPGHMPPGHMQPGHMQQGPLGHGPMQQGPMQQGPMQQGPMQQGALQQGPMQQGPLQHGSVQHGPMQQVPMQQGPMQQGAMPPGHMSQGPMQQAPMQPGSMQQGPGLQGHLQQQGPVVSSQGHMTPGHMTPGHMSQGHMPPQVGANRASSPRTLQNITNRQDAKSPSRQKISQLVSSLNQPPRPAVPGRSPLAQQLQAMASAKDRAAAGVPPPHHETTYYGHDPVEIVPKDVCLLGCVFYITDYQKMLSEESIECWKKKITEHGGIVDDSYSNRVTHLLCEHQRSDVFQMALRDHKRLVTAHWLNDVLLDSRLLPPWRALHLPSIYGEKKPCSNQILCVSNFQDDDRSRVKQMILALGARYTSYMTHANSALICKHPGGVKYQKALDWRIPVVNVQWLTDLLLGKLEALKLPINSAYQQFAHDDPFRLDSWRVAHLIEGWKTPLRISKEAWKMFVPSATRAAELKRQMEQQAQQLEVRRSRHDTNGTSPALHTDGAPVVLITTLKRKQAESLRELVERLGGHVTTLARPGVTHLVSRSIARTVKFLAAISVVRHVVSPDWIEQSAMENKFLDETNFVLRDLRIENDLNFSLQQSLARAHERPLFKGMTFYVTPSVIPSKKVLQEIVENAGGTIVDKRPSVRSILAQKDEKGEPLFVVISSENDVHLCQDLLLRRIPVYHSEFIMTSVLLQTVLHNQFALTMAATTES